MGTRLVADVRPPTYYPADDIPVKVPTARELASKGIAKLRKTIVPGTVLILLAGRFRGRRVVFLKQLPSGTLLVTGPYSANGVPLRRANQRYCIGTSTAVDLGGADVSSITDEFFSRGKKKIKKSTEASMFATEPEARTISDDRKAMQKKVDDAISKKLSAEMKGYLKTRFSLSGGMFPHTLKF